jgi:hypothetical protein
VDGLPGEVNVLEEQADALQSWLDHRGEMEAVSRQHRQQAACLAHMRWSETLSRCVCCSRW